MEKQLTKSSREQLNLSSDALTRAERKFAALEARFEKQNPGGPKKTKKTV